MLPSARGDASPVLPSSEGGHEDTGCPVSHDLQEGEPIGRGWREWMLLETGCILPAVVKEFSE